jgi:hypothetical protein
MLLWTSVAEDGKRVPLSLIVDFQKLPKIKESHANLSVPCSGRGLYQVQRSPVDRLVVNSPTTFSKHWIVVLRILQILSVTKLNPVYDNAGIVA